MKRLVIGRCDECGGQNVELPCRLCSARAATRRALTRRRAFTDVEAASVGLALHRNELAAYETLPLPGPTAGKLVTQPVRLLKTYKRG